MKKITISRFLTGVMVIIGMFLCINMFEICYLIYTGGSNAVILVNIVQSIIDFIILWINWTCIRPSISFIRKQCLEFVKGKTITLETSPDRCLFLEEEEQLLTRINELIDRKVLLQETNKQAEYLALQNQINPHFLYNTLEAIRGDAIMNKMYSLANVAKALSTYFRYTISNMQFLVTVDEELENINNYFLVQKYRFGDRIDMKVNFLDNEEEIRKLFIPKLTLQPIVENSVFHGLERLVDKGIISVTFDQTESNLVIGVKDSGIGMDENALEKLNASLNETPFMTSKKKDTELSNKNHSGIALKNVSRRIKLFFGDEYGIHVYSTKDFGTNVKITIPRQEFNKGQ